MSKLTERIAELEKELDTLKKQEKREKEEAKMKAKQDKEKDFENLTKVLSEYNEKHGEEIMLAIKRRSSTGEQIWSTVFPWIV